MENVRTSERKDWRCNQATPKTMVQDHQAVVVTKRLSLPALRDVSRPAGALLVAMLARWVVHLAAALERLTPC